MSVQTRPAAPSTRRIFQAIRYHDVYRPGLGHFDERRVLALFSEERHARAFCKEDAIEIESFYCLDDSYRPTTLERYLERRPDQAPISQPQRERAVGELAL